MIKGKIIKANIIIMHAIIRGKEKFMPLITINSKIKKLF
tara:strand:- start:158 stop:274 length:117 start_codon:yes stop_codon:yes gene_type:complete